MPWPAFGLAKQDFKDVERQLDKLERSMTEAEEELARLMHDKVNRQNDTAA